MRRLLIAGLIAALAGFASVSGSSMNAGADSGAQCYPLGYESHSRTTGFVARDGLNRDIAAVSNGLVWNDDCYGVDPKSAGTGHVTYNLNLVWCGFDSYVPSFRSTTGHPYAAYRLDYAARWRLGADYCGSSHNVRISVAVEYWYTDVIVWAECWTAPTFGSPGACLNGQFPV